MIIILILIFGLVPVVLGILLLIASLVAMGFLPKTIVALFRLTKRVAPKVAVFSSRTLELPREVLRQSFEFKLERAFKLFLWFAPAMIGFILLTGGVMYLIYSFYPSLFS